MSTIVNAFCCAAWATQPINKYSSYLATVFFIRIAQCHYAPPQANSRLPSLHESELQVIIVKLKKRHGQGLRFRIAGSNITPLNMYGFLVG
jgi:hypothetical protein